MTTFWGNGTTVRRWDIDIRIVVPRPQQSMAASGRKYEPKGRVFYSYKFYNDPVSWIQNFQIAFKKKHDTNFQVLIPDLKSARKTE